ncbi:MAG: FecR domain-containing protein [Leptospiraceae bacterium]|nr:FecR domain-containing protein [Leptospiraceae bacterium]MCP5512542.1 FecR domain-containing protein [Leptospiraceae bacterium]
MNRHFYLILGILISLSFLYCGKPKPISITTGVASSVNGTVKLTSPDGTTVDLKKEMLVSTNDTIETGSKSYVDLELSPSVLLRVKEKSKFRLLEVDIQDKSILAKVEIVFGKLFIKSIGKLNSGSSFKVMTASTLATVRGTEFTVDSIDESNAKILVKEGSVEMTPSVENGESTVVEEGKKGIVEDKLTKVEDLSSEEMEELESDSSELKGIPESTRDKINSMRQNFENQKSKNSENLKDQKEMNRDNLQELKDKSIQEKKALEGKNLNEMNAIKEANQKALSDVKPSGRDAKDAAGSDKSDIESKTKSSLEEFKSKNKLKQ